MQKDNSITYHYQVREYAPSHWFGRVYVEFDEHLADGFLATRRHTLSLLQPFGSETTARKYTKRELQKVMKDYPKYKLKEFLPVHEEERI